MNTQILDGRRDSSGGYRGDVTRGQRVGRVSSEWFSRPADERYLSLNELARSVRDRADRSRTHVVESALIHVEANRADPGRLALMLPGSDTPVASTHWSFGQLASQVGAPAAYLRQLPAALAGINLQYGLTANRAEMVGAFVCASLGIVPTVRHADYIGSWLEVLREDNRAVVRAASAASKAADFLLAFLPPAIESVVDGKEEAG